MFNFQIPKPEVFGNYLLKGFNDIVIPSPVSLMPNTPAAWAAVSFVAALIVFAIWWVIHQWQLNTYRRDALTVLRGGPIQDAIALVPSQLRKVAAKAYPNLPIGALTGEEWFDFLNFSAKSVLFSPRIKQHLEMVTFQSPEAWKDDNELNSLCLEAAVQWIERHEMEKGISL